MRLEFHDSFERPLSTSCTRVVIMDDYGNPLALAVELGPGHVRLSVVTDPDFQRHLDELGITGTVIVNTFGRGAIRPPQV